MRRIPAGEFMILIFVLHADYYVLNLVLVLVGAMLLVVHAYFVCTVYYAIKV